MLRKTHRGLKPSEVSELFQGKAHSVGSVFFRVNWQVTDEEHPQFVVITPRKLHKSAVRRNRLRRMIYEMIRHKFSDWTRGIRVAILVKNAALDVTRREFKDAFDEIMLRAELFLHDCNIENK